MTNKSKPEVELRFITSFLTMSSIKKVILLPTLAFTLLHCFTSAQSINYVDCGSFFTIDNLTVEGCTTGTYCIFLIAQNTTLSFTLNSGLIDIDAELINDVAFMIRGIKFDTEVVPVDPCQQLKCPIEQNYSSQYVAEVYATDKFDPTYADLRWIMKTAQEEQLLCFEFSVLLLNAE